MIFKHIVFNNKTDYQKALNLRDQVLRKPIGLELSGEDTKEDNQSFMLGAFQTDGEIEGFVMLLPKPEGFIQLRQLCVLPEDQHKGIGKNLLTYAEITALSNGYSEIKMSARKSAEGFYEKQGYHIYGEPFVLRTLPHIYMKKELKTIRE